MNGRSLFAIGLTICLTGTAFAENEAVEPANTKVQAMWETASLAISDSPDADVSSFPSAGSRTAALAPVQGLRSPFTTDGSFEQPSGSTFKLLGVSMFVVAGADLASTELGLSRPGIYEANPVQGNRSVRVLTHVAIPAFMFWATQKIHDDGNPKLALLARIGFNVAYSYVVMHNLRTTAATP